MNGIFTCELELVPARDWPEGTLRPIYIITGEYPRQVREDRGFTWSKHNLEQMPQRPDWEDIEKSGSSIIGYIPQVAHTYALIEGMYGIMNEHQVAIGESTCAARLFAAPVSAGGKALLEASELTQIALERSKTAREAIQIMGDLAQKYGYYSAEWNTNKYGEAYAMGEGGEALTVVDTEEAWMFHIIPDDTGTSAVWVAQRVPDNHVAVAANTFVIREVLEGHPDFLYSSNLWSVAERKGWWSSSTGQPLNFLKTYAPQRYHPSYSYRRVWRIFSLAAPDLHLPGQTNGYADDYPFSVPVTRPEGPFSPAEVMALQRDHFEGTPYSTTQGLAAGPYGDPNRFDIWSNGDMTVWEANEGEFQRTISLFRTSYAFVSEPRSTVSSVFTRLWLCQYAPDMSSFTPVYVHSNALSSYWTSGTMQKFTTTSAWWNFCVVGNYASRFYSFTIQAIRSLQKSLEVELLDAVKKYEEKAARYLTSGTDKDMDKAISLVTSLTIESGDRVAMAWRDYFPTLVTTYRDGYIIGGQKNSTVTIKRMFYPRWWLQAVGFFDVGGNKDGILFAPAPAAPSAGTMSTTISMTLQPLYFLLTALVFFVVGLGLGRRSSSSLKTVPRGKSGPVAYVRIDDDDVAVAAALNEKSLLVRNARPHPHPRPLSLYQQ